MKILKLYISNYGKIKDREVSFSEDITQIFGENGYGKTTIMSFIKAMLYGLSSSRITDKVMGEREHFCPFDRGDNFGGSITLLKGDDEIKIERFFDKKSSTKDQIKVYKNGQLIDLNGEEPGRKFLALMKNRLPAPPLSAPFQRRFLLPLP